MEFLDYDDAEEDLTVVVTAHDESVFCEVAINSTLLKMLSPWWKMRLTSIGFRTTVHDHRCTVSHESPEIAELALRAAKLRLNHDDLIAEDDLNTVFKLWRLADMWQFGYLSKLCQEAIKTLLTQTDADALEEFITSALEHNETVVDDVLLPLLLECPQFRSPSLYLAFDDSTLFKLAELAPMAGFQTNHPDFAERLTDHVAGLADDDFVRYIARNW